MINLMASTAKKECDKQRWRARREVMPGFPRTEPITTAEELREYRSGDRIQCLLCGKFFKALSRHIEPIHEVTVEEYHRMYGLPWSRGLTSDETHEKKSAVLKRRIEAGEWDPTANSPPLDEIRKNTERERFPVHDDIVRKECLSKTPTHKGEDTRIWREEHYDEFLRRIASGRTRIEVCSDPDMPRFTAMIEKLRGDPDFRNRYDKIRWTFPYGVQVRTGGLGPKFDEELKSLLDLGLSHQQCAEILGVHKTAIFTHAKRIRG